jgi:hypothetical protein
MSFRICLNGYFLPCVMVVSSLHVILSMCAVLHLYVRNICSWSSYSLVDICRSMFFYLTSMTFLCLWLVGLCRLHTDCGCCCQIFFLCGLVVFICGDARFCLYLLSMISKINECGSPRGESPLCVMMNLSFDIESAYVFVIESVFCMCQHLRFLVRLHGLGTQSRFSFLNLVRRR